MNTYITTFIVIAIAYIIIHQHYIIARVIHQNNKFIHDADHRLDKANEMVLTLTHSADLLSETIRELKDILAEREKSFDIESKTLVQSREEYRESYRKLLAHYNELSKRLRELADEDHNALKELARRPTIANNNTPNHQSL